MKIKKIKESMMQIFNKRALYATLIVAMGISIPAHGVTAKSLTAAQQAAADAQKQANTYKASATKLANMPVETAYKPAVKKQALAKSAFFYAQTAFVKAQAALDAANGAVQTVLNNATTKTAKASKLATAQAQATLKSKTAANAAAQTALAKAQTALDAANVTVQTAHDKLTSNDAAVKDLEDKINAAITAANQLSASTTALRASQKAVISTLNQALSALPQENIQDIIAQAKAKAQEAANAKALADAAKEAADAAQAKKDKQAADDAAQALKDKQLAADIAQAKKDKDAEAAAQANQAAASSCVSALTPLIGTADFATKIDDYFSSKKTTADDPDISPGTDAEGKPLVGEDGKPLVGHTDAAIAINQNKLLMNNYSAPYSSTNRYVRFVTNSINYLCTAAYKQ